MVLLRCWVRSAADGMDDEVEASRLLQGAESDESVTLIFKAVITRNLVTASQPQIWIRRSYFPCAVGSYLDTIKDCRLCFPWGLRALLKT